MTVAAPAPRPRPSDGELLSAARAGDAASLGALLDRCRAPLYASALRILRFGPEAEDALHETFLVALRRIGDVRDPEAFRGWIHAVLRRCCLQQIRRRRPAVALDAASEVADPSPRPDEHLDRLALGEWIRDALDALPERLRVTALLRYFSGFRSYEEIAAILDVPLGTVRSRLAQAKLSLAERLLERARPPEADRARVGPAARLVHFGACPTDEYCARPADFLDHYDEDLELLIVQRRGDVYRGRGRERLGDEIRDDADAGTRFLVERVLPSGTVSIVEGRFENAPDTPDHCPPGGALVHFHDGGRTRRLHIYLAAHPPAAED